MKWYRVIAISMPFRGEMRKKRLARLARCHADAYSRAIALGGHEATAERHLG